MTNDHFGPIRMILGIDMVTVMTIAMVVVVVMIIVMVLVLVMAMGTAMVIILRGYRFAGC